MRKLKKVLIIYFVVIGVGIVQADIDAWDIRFGYILGNNVAESADKWYFTLPALTKAYSAALVLIVRSSSR